MILYFLLAGDDVMSFDVTPTGLHLQGSGITSSLADDLHHLIPCCKEGCHIAEHVLFLK